MTDQLEAVLGQITELTNLVKDNKGTAGLDVDALMAKFQELLREQQAALLDQIPNRPGEFQTDPINRAVEGYTGKYRRELSDIAKDGRHRIGNWEVHGTDLILAKLFLEKASALKAQGVAFAGQEAVKPPSDDLVKAVKALTSTGSGTGDELVPTNMATELWQDFFAASRIAGDLPNQPMPTDPFDISLGFGTITFRKGGQNAAVVSNNPTTAKSTLTSTEQVAEVDWSYNLDEDAVVAIMPSLRQAFTRDGAETMDAFCLNADATATASANINLIDGTPASDQYYLSDGQDGIRHLWLVDNTAQANTGGGDALADADMISGLNDLSKYGLDPEQCRIVPGIASYFAMLGLTNVATVDKYGPQATIVRGELMRYRGVPVIPSASMELVYSAGKKSATAGNNTLGAISMYNRNMWKVGFRRGLLIEVDRNIQSRQLIMVVSFRIAIAAQGTRSTATHTSGIYNFTV